MRQIFTTALHPVRRVASQHRDRSMTTDYCDVTSPYVYVWLRYRVAYKNRLVAVHCVSYISQHSCVASDTLKACGWISNGDFITRINR